MDLYHASFVSECEQTVSKVIYKKIIFPRTRSTRSKGLIMDITEHLYGGSIHDSMDHLLHNICCNGTRSALKAIVIQGLIFMAGKENIVDELRSSAERSARKLFRKNDLPDPDITSD